MMPKEPTAIFKFDDRPEKVVNKIMESEIYLYMREGDIIECQFTDTNETCSYKVGPSENFLFTRGYMLFNLKRVYE